MMKYLFIIFLVFHSLVICSQVEFSKTINIDSLGTSIGITLAYDELENSLLIQSGNGCNNICFGLTKVTEEGVVLWEKTYEDEEENIGFEGTAGSMLINLNGDIALGGSIDVNNSTLRNYFLMLTDSEGDSLWLKTYPNIGPDLAKVLGQFPDGGYLISGTNGYDAEQDIRLIRTDIEGEIIWEKSYESIFPYSNVYTISIDNNDIIIGGQVVQQENEDSDAYFAKISDEEEGEIVWEVFWGTEVNECPAYLRPVSNEEAYIVAWCVDIPDSEYDRTNRIRKIDDDLNILWEYDFPLSTVDMKQLTTIKILEDGSTLGVGILDDDDFSDYMYDTYDKLFWRMVWMFKISPEGELEWERVFYDSDFVHFFDVYDVLQTPDGSIYTVGQTTDSLVVANEDSTYFNTIYDTNIWLVRFDENGCFNGDCGPDNGGYWDLSGKINTSVGDLSSKIGGLSVYPNPSSGVFRLDLSAILSTDLSYQLYDVSGRLMKGESIVGNSAFVEVDLSAYDQGVYFLQLYEEGVLLGVERLVLIGR